MINAQLVKIKTLPWTKEYEPNSLPIDANEACKSLKKSWTKKEIEDERARKEKLNQKNNNVARKASPKIKEISSLLRF